jgi:PleD family two-component response regulator
MTKRILILDDMEERHAHFKRELAGQVVFHAYTAQEFFDTVEQHAPFDEIYLDHDLGDNPKIDPTRIAGMYGDQTMNGHDCAYWLGTNHPDKVKQVIVHSINSARAPAMVATLKDKGVPAKWIPFFQMI